MMKITIYNQEKSAKSILWDFQRFGLAPGKLPARIYDLAATRKEQRPLMLCSLPKSGTHLIETILCMHPSIYRPFVPTLEHRNLDRLGGLESRMRKLRGGQLLVSHLPHDPQIAQMARDLGVGVVFLKRDPRAVLASDVRYIEKRTDHYLHPHQMAREGVHAKIQMQLEGVPECDVPPFAERLRSYLGWESEDDVLCLRFEQISTVEDGSTVPEAWRKLFAFAGAQVDEQWLEALPARLPTSATPTYRSGSKDGWRRELPPETIETINAALGETLSAFGYE